MMERIAHAEFLRRCEAQGVSHQKHWAFKCPICRTVQSSMSLLAAGAPKEKIENVIGFSCEGRYTNAGSWPRQSDRGAKAMARRQVRGCDWTLGGLFRLHELEVEIADGETTRVVPCFEIAAPQEAKWLEARMPRDEEPKASVSTPSETAPPDAAPAEVSSA